PKHHTGEEAGAYRWRIIAHIPAHQLSPTLPLFIRSHITIYLAMFLFITLGSWVLAGSHRRHRLAEAQRDYEQRFRRTLENIDLAAIAVDRDGTITFCNDCFLRITGWQRDQVITHHWLSRFTSDESRAEVAGLMDLLAEPEHFPARVETRVRTRQGEQRLFSWNNTLSFDGSGQVIGLTAIGEDITVKRRSETELLKLSQAVEQSPSIVMITDSQGSIDYVNPKFTEVSGYTREEVLGKNPRFLKSGETSTQEYGNLWDTVMAGGEWRGEFHNRRKNGELYWEAASISAIRDPRGSLTHFLAVKEDITERKRLEQEVAERNRELAHSETLAAMGRMASMIAHDLRNPLSSVKMTLQILGKQPGMEENREADELRLISLEQIRYMEEILSDLLVYSRPDALTLDWITIDKVIEMAVSLSRRRLEEAGAELNINYHPGVPTLHGDPTKLRQAFSNLISNAAQAVEETENARIDIDVMLELGPEGTAVRTEIRDNGPGVPPGERERILEAFHTTRAKGTGLGLAIVKRIIDQHRGQLIIGDNQPGGACITVILPVGGPWEAAGTQTDTGQATS
ncbi:MAG: PAS domain-containing sensor histidine kinase, partial [Candidatus Sedimenticola endophacoides]